MCFFFFPIQLKLNAYCFLCGLVFAKENQTNPVDLIRVSLVIELTEKF